MISVIKVLWMILDRVYFDDSFNRSLIFYRYINKWEMWVGFFGVECLREDLKNS